METNKELFAYIKEQINNVPNTFKYAKKVKVKIIAYYKQHYTELDIFSSDIKQRDFTAELLSASEAMEKCNIIPKLLNVITKLERHQYAPEMNKIHFKNCTVSTPQKVDMNTAVAYVVKTMSAKQLKELINDNK